MQHGWDDVETERSWVVSISKIIESGYNLSAGHYNPNGPEEEILLEPQEYAEQIKTLLSSALVEVNSLISELKET